MGEELIYRDDDINYLTCADELKRIHEPFARRGIVHTVAVEFYCLWENKSLFHFLKSDPFISVELHGWQHVDYSKGHWLEIAADFIKARVYWEKKLGEVPENLKSLKTITTHFPTWNRVSDNLQKTCDDLGLRLSHDRSEYAWQFHYWEVTAEDVEAVLSGRVTAKEMQRKVKHGSKES